MTARDEMVDYGIGSDAAERLSENIHSPFRDFLILAEAILGRGGALTRSQTVFLEVLYGNYNIGREREIWEGLRQAPERQKSAKRRPVIRREVVVIYGHRVTVYRNTRTGRWSSRRR